jgi:quinol monooxygenase YgiN
MWAQLIKSTLKPGGEQHLGAILDQLHAVEQPGSGLLRTLAMRDQADPSQLYLLVLFESEQHARDREQDPRRSDGLAAVRALMSQAFEQTREFTNLTVVRDF